MLKLYPVQSTTWTSAHRRGDCKEQVAQPYPGALRAYLRANEPNDFRPAQVNWAGTCQSTHRLEQSHLQYGSLCIPVQIDLKSGLKSRFQVEKVKITRKMSRKYKLILGLFQNFDSNLNTNQDNLVIRSAHKVNAFIDYIFNYFCLASTVVTCLKI